MEEDGVVSLKLAMPGRKAGRRINTSIIYVTA